MIEAERVSRIQRLKFNKKLINRIVIVSEFGRTWKGKITNVIDHETFQIEQYRLLTFIKYVESSENFCLTA